MTRAPDPSPDLLFWRLTTLLCGAGFAALALFVADPGIDLWASGLFFDGARFPPQSAPAIAAARLFYKAAFAAACAGAALMAALRLIRRDGWRTPLRLWLFVCALMAIGPGLIANVLLKDHWGRPRPDSVTAFGGPHPLTPPFVLSDACASNCSFVSGEGAAAAALAFAALAVLWPTFDAGRARARAVAATALWLFGAGLIRIAPGKHFLSDTIFAFILMGLTAATLYQAFDLRRARKDATPDAVRQDAQRAVALVSGVLAQAWRGLRRIGGGASKALARVARAKRRVVASRLAYWWRKASIGFIRAARRAGK